MLLTSILVFMAFTSTNLYTHTHRGMERHGEGHTQSDAHKGKERGREEEGGMTNDIRVTFVQYQLLVLVCVVVLFCVSQLMSSFDL